MLRIAHAPIYQHPLPAGHRFPMDKYELIPMQLIHEGTATIANFFEPKPIEESWILRTHDRAYWQALQGLSLDPKMVRKIGFPLSAELVNREIVIAQGTVQNCLDALKFGVAFNVAGGTDRKSVV